MLAVNETTLTKNAQVRMDLDKASLVGATHPHRPASAQRMAATGDGNHTAGRSAPTTTNARDLEKLVQYSCGDQRPEYLSAPLVHKAFEAAAAAHPQRRCLCFDGEWVCYSEVNRRATQMAESLAGFGVRPGTVVALFLERSLELVVAMVAVFKAGGCYLPCDPSYPDARLSVYLDDGSAHVVMVDAQHSERVRGMVASGVRIVRVDVEQAGGQGRQIDLVRACAEDPAYMIFTSGSTGRPKGVVVPHAGLRDLLPWLVEQFKLTVDDIIVFSNTINFDASVIQALSPLSIGASLVIADPNGHMLPSYIVQLIISTNATGLICTAPILAREYLKEFKHAGAAPYLPMKAWGLGGESPSLDIVRDMQEVFPNLLGPMNMYGPTEATAVTVQHVFPRKVRYVCIGRPDPNVHVYVVDSALRPVPLGVPGELLLSGPRLALGYAGRPDLTAQAFVPNPCLELVAGRIHPALAPYYTRAYRTGDLVEWYNDGTLHFLGRMDRQVKIAGVRIELGEVEAAMLSTSGVTQAVAAAVPGPDGHRRIVGYVTPATTSVAKVLARCWSMLLPAALPSKVVPLEAIPLLPNGKVDVRALPVPTWHRSTSRRFVMPSDKAEEAVERIFRQVLELDEALSSNADFFSVGGTSLQVFQAAALLAREFKLDFVAPSLLHIYRTVGGVAAALADIASGASAAPASEPILPRQWSGPTRPLSSNQEQMWVLSQMGMAAAYSISAAIALQQPLEPAPLQQALNDVTARHEVLRSRYALARDGLLEGLVAPVEECRAQLRTLHGMRSKDEVDAALAGAAAAAFDLATGPLIKALLILTQAPDLPPAILSLSMHHAVGDAWSVNLLWKEVGAAYAARKQGHSPEWQALPIQYGDYAQWQQKHLSGKVGRDLRQFWKEQLNGVCAQARLPYDRERPGKPAYSAGAVHGHLSAHLLRQLGQRARELHVNLQALLLGAFHAVLLPHGETNDLVVGVPVAGRDRPETHGLVGYFINTLPVRCPAPPPSCTFGDMIKAASAATVAVLDCCLLPLEHIVRASGVQRIPGANPLFQIIFQYLPAEEAGTATKFGDVEAAMYSIPYHKKVAQMDLTLVLHGGAVTIEYMTELFDESTISELLGCFVKVLDNIAVNPEAAALCDLDLGGNGVVPGSILLDEPTASATSDLAWDDGYDTAPEFVEYSEEVLQTETVGDRAPAEVEKVARSSRIRWLAQRLLGWRPSVKRPHTGSR